MDQYITSNSSDIRYYPPSHWTYPGTSGECGNDYTTNSGGTKGDSITLKFKGIAAYINLVRFPAGARASIELNGTKVAQVDTYLSWLECSTPVFEKTGLSYGLHTIRISNVDANSTDLWLRFRSLRYTLPQSDSDTSSVIPSPASTATSTPTAIQAVNTVAKSFQKAIIGGSVGGGIALILFVGLLWFFLRRSRKRPIRDADPWIPAAGIFPVANEGKSPLSDVPPQSLLANGRVADRPLPPTPVLQQPVQGASMPVPPPYEATLLSPVTPSSMDIRTIADAVANEMERRRSQVAENPRAAKTRSNSDNL